MQKGKYRKGVFIVTYVKTKKEIEYLILKRKLHWIGWEFPKGGIKNKEKIIDAIKREIFEETGQKPFNIKRFKISGKYKYKKEFIDRPGIIGQTYSLYIVEIKNRKIKLDKLEHSNYKWVDFKNAMKKLTWLNQRKTLKSVNTLLKNEI
ncbi:hypothetical protein CMI39_01925 [Candidatus Pacearchaeota archaeon]|jgi:8-oxo-dGTP pyrophosphatase MutT (NUDIX family)|nr:hypothetical protein [Candidatus Pacearchaeota archaeon]|tara:strand:- start:2699 stop:3145 length:447 start_codon:yes stop_codon:yes gene_type:complete